MTSTSEETLLQLANEDLRVLLQTTGASLIPCMEQLDRYRDLIQAEAAVRNITKYKGPHEIVLYHFVDSLQVLTYS
ncbi:MAG: hypothetical protein ABIH23_04155, partial [bacterium]